MKEIIVGIGGIGISQDPDDILVTHSLGSCVALIIYDKITKTAGLAHIALNNSNTSKEKAQNTPGYFADTSIDKLLNMMEKKGVEINKKNLIIKIAGGAQVIKKMNFFDIGQKNTEAIKSIIKEKKLQIMNEDVGGNISRTVRIEVETGKVTIKNMTLGTWEI